MQTKINDLLDLHNDMWITLHRLKKAHAEHKKISTNPSAYYEVFAKQGELEEEIAWKESLVRALDNQYQEQYSQLKNLTEQI